MAKNRLSDQPRADGMPGADASQMHNSSLREPADFSESTQAAGTKHRRPKYSPDVVIEALRAAGGIKSAAAAKLGASRNTLDAYIQSNHRIRKALDEIEEETLDLAETGLVNALRAERPWAIQFYLRTKGRRRGYVERREIADDGAAAQSSRIGNELALQRAVRGLAPEVRRALLGRLAGASTHGHPHRQR